MLVAECYRGGLYEERQEPPIAGYSELEMSPMDTAEPFSQDDVTSGKQLRKGRKHCTKV